MKKKESIKGQLRAVVLQILTEKKESYAYEIIRIVKEKTNSGILITEGALYPVLHKLEAEGILSSQIKNIGNRNRKYYFLTEKGKKESALHLESIREFIRHLNMLLNPDFKHIYNETYTRTN